MGSEEEKPSLEAPSLGFWKRKKADARPSGESATEPGPPSVEDSPRAVPEVLEVPEVPEVPESPEVPRLSDVPEPPEPTRPPRGPMNGHLAAAIAGVLVGAFLVLATLGGLDACESVRGTTSCGGGPGFLLLVLIVVLAVVVGWFVLWRAQVPSAGSISLLAVALVSVLSGLFLLDVLDQLAGGVAVALLAVASYLLAHWVTVRYLDAAA